MAFFLEGGGLLGMDISPRVPEWPERPRVLSGSGKFAYVWPRFVSAFAQPFWIWIYVAILNYWPCLAFWKQF